MQIVMPDYYDAFHCLAGACPHSCCMGWDVVIDPETAARYRQVEGTLGEELRAALTRDEEGDICFLLQGGRCPFLDEDHLCRIHRRLGQEATSLTCREHPRFIEDYGCFQEVTLSASCPEANRLLLGTEEPLTFRLRETAQPPEEGEVDPWLEPLLALRRRMLELVQDRAYPLRRRLSHFLLLALEAQALLDEERIEEVHVLAQTWRVTGKPVVPTERAKLFPQALEYLLTLETLEPDWPGLLRQAEKREGRCDCEALLERITVYFAFRYLLKTINDGDLLSRAELCIFAVLLIERLAQGTDDASLGEALRRFSVEMEHSQQNLDALQAAFQEGVFSPSMFFGELES